MSDRPQLTVLRGGAAPALRGGQPPLVGGAARAPRGGHPAIGGGSAPALRGSRGVVGAALQVAGSWLLEPAEPAGEPIPVAPAPPRPVIAVFGLARGCGTTVVARALAAELAGRDPAGAAAVHCEARAAGIPLATQPATRLARALADVPGADTRAVGRLCLVGGAERSALADCARHLAPLVIDAGSTSLGGVPAALADRVIVVATPGSEPALAGVAADCLARLGHDPIIVLNRADSCGARGHPTADAPPPEANGTRSGWSGRRAHPLPDSRMGAQLALGGREARGELGQAVAELADLCEERR
jgi:hypothetical protein